MFESQPLGLAVGLDFLKVTSASTLHVVLIWSSHYYMLCSRGDAFLQTIDSDLWITLRR